MAVDERLERIFVTIEKRKETFGKVIVGLAFSKDNKNELRAAFGIVKFLMKEEASSEQTTYDYGNFVLTKRILEIQDALSLLRSVFESQILKLNGLPEIPLKVHLGETRFVQSCSHHGYISSEWPMLYSYSRIDDSTRGNIPQDSLSKLGLPLFPSGMEAINVFFELNLPTDWYTLESRIELLVPDYRARIKNLRLAGNRVTLEEETKEIDNKDTLAKFFCKSENKSYTSKDLPIANGYVTFVTEDEPVQVEAHILSATDGETIDKRSFDYRYPTREGIIIENIEAQLLDIIAKGENENVEFKRELNNAEFLETVVAFANTGGGTIFLGVDNNCRIKGFNEDVKAKIVDLISDHCDPSIEVHVDSVLVNNIPIILVKVAEGTNRPYTLKDRGIFVRRGSSDRLIKRTELDDIYAKKQQSSLYR